MIGRSIGRYIHGDAKEEQESKVSLELKHKRSVDERIRRMDNAVIYNLVQLMLSIYEPGEDSLMVCHQRYQTPREALDGLRQQHKIPNQVMRGMIDSAEEDQADKKLMIPTEPSQSRSRSRERDRKKRLDLKPRRARSTSPSLKPRQPRGPPPTLVPNPQAKERGKLGESKDPGFYPDGQLKIVHNDDIFR